MFHFFKRFWRKISHESFIFLGDFGEKMVTNLPFFKPLFRSFRGKMVTTSSIFLGDFGEKMVTNVPFFKEILAKN